MHFARPILVLLIASSILTGTVRAQEPSYTLSGCSARMGDDPWWTQPGGGDGWQDFDTWYYSPASDTTALFWVRATVQVHNAPDVLKGLSVSLIGAIEVYWDGHLIGRSGRVGTSLETEVPGPIDALFLLPDSLFTPGPHTLAARVSNFHVQRRIRYYFQDLEIGDYLTMARAPIRKALLPLFFLGAFLLIALYYLLLYLITDRRRAYLLFALLCFSVSILLVAESWRGLVGYRSDWHLTRLWIVAAATCVIGVLLPLFFMVQFSFPRRRFWLALLAVLLGLSAGLPVAYNTKSAYLFLTMLSLSLVIVVWAIVQRKEGSGFALAGVVTCAAVFVLDTSRFLDVLFFPTFAVLIACLLASLSLQSRRQRAEHERALVQAARLEIELLKKNIRPHFLMNSLTAAIEWIEEAPAVGVKFLEALADEFRILSDVSNKTLIPLAKEIALCRSHLAIMGYQKDLHFELVVEDVAYDDRVPPALFHTLVENGLTHNAYDAAPVCFRLTGARLPNGRRYTFVTPTNGSDLTTASRDGTGLRYVKARLEESFPGRWRLDATPSDDAWTTVIDIYDHPPP